MLTGEETCEVSPLLGLKRRLQPVALVASEGLGDEEIWLLFGLSLSLLFGFW